MTTQNGGKKASPLMKKSNHGNKLRHNKDQQDFLCLTCVGSPKRVSRVPSNLCLRKFRNGTFLLQTDSHCVGCNKKSHPVYKIVSAEHAKVLIKQGVHPVCAKK